MELESFTWPLLLRIQQTSELKSQPDSVNIIIRQYPDASSPLLIETINMHMMDFFSIHAPVKHTPLEAISQLIICAKQRVIAPSWAGNVLEKTVHIFLTGAKEPKEEGSVARLLGLSASRGKTSEAKARLLAFRDMVLFNYVWGLYECGIAVKHACDRVVNWLYSLERTTLYHHWITPLKRKKSFKKTLLRDFYEWKRTDLLLAEKLIPDRIVKLRNDFQENKAAILETFPMPSR